MTVDYRATAHHLRSTMKAMGLHKDMVTDSKIEGPNLVLEWKRLNTPPGVPNTPNKDGICFANTASAEYARDILIYGTSNLGDDVKETKPAVAKHASGAARDARTFEAC